MTKKLMTEKEHTGIYQAIAETIVQEELELDERVERGALHLDEHFPGWANKINLKTFNIRNAEQCVIGQLYGDYWDHTINQVAKIYPQRTVEDFNYLDDPKLDKFAADHGFFTNKNNYPSDDQDDQQYDDWDVLQESWKKAIGTRQNG